MAPTSVKMSQEKATKEALNCARECVLSIEEKDMQHWSKQEKFRWTLVFFFGSMLVYAVRVSMSIAAPAIGKELSWNKQESGMALSAFYCGYLLTNIKGGSLSDRIGGQRVICCTTFGWGTLTLILPFLVRAGYGIFSGTVAVLWTRFFTGVCQGVFFPSVTAILTKHVSVLERSSILGLIHSGSAIGTTATGLLGSLIIEHINWTYLFVCVGTLVLAWTLWMRYLMALPDGDPIIIKPASKPKEPVPWLKLASRAPFWALLVAYSINNYCFYNLLSWIPLYFHDSFPEGKGWVFNVIPWFVLFGLTVISGHFADMLIDKGSSITFVRKLFAAITFLGTAVFTALLNSAGTFCQSVLMTTLTIGVQAFGTCSVTINASDLAPKHAGALHGFMNSCGALAGFIGVYFTGHILQATGKWSSVFLLTIVSSLIGFVPYQVFGSGERIV